MAVALSLVPRPRESWGERRGEARAGHGASACEPGGTRGSSKASAPFSESVGPPGLKSESPEASL